MDNLDNKDNFDSELESMREIIGDTKTPAAPQPRPNIEIPQSDYNIDEILSEISGVVDETRADPVRAAQNEQKARSGSVPIPPSAPQTAPAQAAPVQQAAPQHAEINVEYNPHEPGEDHAPVNDPVPLNRKQRKAVARKQRRESEAAADAQQNVVAKDPEREMRRCAARIKSLNSRSLLVLLLGLLAFYLTIASGTGLPVPSMLSYVNSPFLTVLCLLAFQVFAMLLGMDVIGLGFFNMVSGHSDRASIVALSCVASLLHAMTIILLPSWGGYLPYCAVTTLLIAAMMREEKNRLAGRMRAYKVATMHSDPIGVRCHYDEDDKTNRAVKSRSSDLERFLREMERPDYTEKFTRIYAPLVLILALVLTVVATFLRGKPTEFFWIFASLMAVAAPLPVLCAYGRAYLHVSRRLLSEGAALASARCANQLSRVRDAVVTDTDLFPAASISLGQVTTYNNYAPEKLLSYCVTMTTQQGMEVGEVLANALREKYGSPARVGKTQKYDFGGIASRIGNDTVLIGTPSFMERIGITFGDIGKVHSCIMIAINNQPAGMIELEYHPSAQTFKALHALRRMRIIPILALRDFNVTAEMISQLFEIKMRDLDEVSPDRLDAVCSPEYAEDDAVCAILTRDGAVPYAQVLQSADRLSAAVRSNLYLGVFAGVLGMLIMFYLACKGAYATITPQNALLYMVLWYIPSMFVTFHARKGL